MDVRENLMEFLIEVACKWGGQIGLYGYMADRLIADGWTKQEWISVKDRLPDKNRESVLIALRWDDTDIGWYDKEDKCWRSEYVNCYDAGEVTHWQYLPQPPKE